MDINKEIIFGTSDSVESRRITRMEKEGKLKKIAPRIYTSNLLDSDSNIIRRNLLEVIAWRLPGAIISHRSAFSMAPTPTGDFFLTAGSSRLIDDIPGIRLNVMKGLDPLPSDIKLGEMPLYVSSDYRRTLEILQSSRKKGDESKSLPPSFVEKRMESLINSQGEDAVNRFRDEARNIAAQCGMEKEFDKLDKIISALLATRPASILTTESGKARAAGMPYDEQRAQLFSLLYDTLSSKFFKEILDKNGNESSFRLFSFFESYFSNYIEGTKFKVEEALEIVETGKIIPKRINDSHDILGTFKIVSNRTEMNIVPETENDFLAILKHRHAILMEGRPDMEPGVFKTKANQAGNTIFVLPHLVEGTLRYGFRLYTVLTDPFAKAIFMMFVCSEVHPFNDGNGRVSRIMMNAELVKSNRTRIIVPTVFLEDYLLSLKRFSRLNDPSVYIRVMEKLQLFSSHIVGDNFDDVYGFLKESEAFEEPESGKLKF
ncbi:Fic family protein [Proteiniphilum sp.]|uniref:Fic family protein n=1 Tax=Proteiniphilum sp. TaxID=1926877 RepID=UPI00333431D8